MVRNHVNEVRMCNLTCLLLRCIRSVDKFVFLVLMAHWHHHCQQQALENAVCKETQRRQNEKQLEFIKFNRCMVKLHYLRTTRSSTHSHPFHVSLPNPRTLSHKSSFIPRTCNLWNVLPSSCFPESYNLPSFKSKINKLDLISLSS